MRVEKFSGGTISTLSFPSGDSTNGPTVDRNIIVRAARQLLSSVTRVLLIADRVMVKQILKAEDKVAYSLTRLENTNNFTEFVKIFTQFGGEMVDLAHKTGDRQHVSPILHFMRKDVLSSFLNRLSSHGTSQIVRSKI